jgi:NadR type nicotinamide-nucleotide adenylyltransferase
MRARPEIIRIAVIGAESTGKTMLCEQLAAHYNTVWVPEYAREYFNDAERYEYSAGDLEVIAYRQTELEEQYAAAANRFLFCDSALITLKIWAELEFEMVPPMLTELLKEPRYDHYFITDNSVAWASDRLRQNRHSRDMLLEMNENEVKRTGIPYSFISGTGNARLENAVAFINKRFPG